MGPPDTTDHGVVRNNVPPDSQSQGQSAPQLNREANNQKDSIHREMESPDDPKGKRSLEFCSVNPKTEVWLRRPIIRIGLLFLQRAQLLFCAINAPTPTHPRRGLKVDCYGKLAVACLLLTCYSWFA
jgi:hypothetical protein